MRNTAALLAARETWPRHGSSAIIVARGRWHYISGEYELHRESSDICNTFLLSAQVGGRRCSSKQLTQHWCRYIPRGRAATCSARARLAGHTAYSRAGHRSSTSAGSSGKPDTPRSPAICMILCSGRATNACSTKPVVLLASSAGAPAANVAR